MTKNKDEKPVTVHIRETFEAQLPLIAAILAIGVDEFNPEELAQDALDLVIAIEERLA